VIAKGVLSEAEFTEHSAALTRHLGHPATILLDNLLVQAWERKPRDGALLSEGCGRWG
jgi:hypothetical protein